MSSQRDETATNNHTASCGDRDARQPLLVARGTGGRLILWEDQVWLTKHGLFNSIVKLFGFGHGRSNKTIVIKQISSVTIVQPILFPNFIFFTYPGSPVSTGNSLRDAVAENALLMNVFDNRCFFELKSLMDKQRHAH